MRIREYRFSRAIYQLVQENSYHILLTLLPEGSQLLSWGNLEAPRQPGHTQNYVLNVSDADQWAVRVINRRFKDIPSGSSKLPIVYLDGPDAKV